MLATGIVVGIGLVPAAACGLVLATSLRISALVSLGVGTGCFVFESMRAQRDAAVADRSVLEAERERAEKLATEARLASLESRLHPHFLFNTLNAISALIPEDPARAERLVEQLAALLRFSLDAGERHTVSVGAEVAIVRAYLGIEEARLGDRLRCAIDVPDALASCDVPALALHTLVQNSVKHVAAARVEPTEIRVRVEARAGRLHLSVWDGETSSTSTPSPPATDSTCSAPGSTCCTVRPAGSRSRGRGRQGGVDLAAAAAPGVIRVAGRLRAFLVDDEPLALTRLARLLAATGRVELVGQALSPDGALAALTEGAADVVFLDIHMPGMSGLALAERLPRDLAVVFTTAYDQHAPRGVRRQCRGLLAEARRSGAAGARARQARAPPRRAVARRHGRGAPAPGHVTPRRAGPITRSGAVSHARRRAVRRDQCG